MPDYRGALAGAPPSLSPRAAWHACNEATCEVRFQGDFNDEGGVTSGDWRLTLSGDVLSGEKSWTWQDDKGSCTDGVSTVVGSRR